MRSWMSRGVPELSGGEELYIGSVVSANGKVSGSPVLYRDHRMGPGGPPGGATHPGGPHGLKWEGEPAHSGLVRPPPWDPHAPRVGNPRGGGASTCLGGQVSPLGRRPPRRSHLLGPVPPWGPYIKRGVGGQPHPDTWRLPSPFATPLPPADAW